MTQLSFWFAESCCFCKRPFDAAPLVFEHGRVRHRKCHG